MTRFLLVALPVIIVFVLGVALGHYNSDPVPFDYLFGTAQVSLIVILLIVFALGVLVTLFVCTARILGMRAELRRTQRQLRDMEVELRTLRNLPPASSR